MQGIRFGERILPHGVSPRLRGLLLALLLAAAFVALASESAAAMGKRVALVIGNGDYKFAPQLDNPVGDAKAVAEVFKRLGFQVVEGYDLSIAQMRSTLSDFTAALPDSEAAIVYYAGHGVFVDDENYLLPTDIALKAPSDLDLNAIGVSLVLRQMRREERANVVILDACRNNPFAGQLARAKTRAIVGEQGLSRIEGDLARGSLIAFASDPKSVALDGRRGEHSPFTKALLDHLEDPNVSVETMMSRVRAEVWEATKNQQLPWVNTSLIGELDLNPQPAVAVPQPPAAAAPPAPADRQATENLLWESAERSHLAGDYQAYLDAFPTGVFAPIARNRIAALTAPPAASAIAPSTKRCKAGETMNAAGECLPRPAARARSTHVPPRKVVAAPAAGAHAAASGANAGAAAASANADPNHLCEPGLHPVLRPYRAYTCEPN